MITRLMLLVSAVAVAMLAPAQLHAQTGEDALRFAERSPATGARMLGMAGAGIVGVGDYGAFYANPAGLGYLESSTLGASLSALSATDESTYQTTGFTTLGEGDVRATHLGNLAYLYKVPTSQGSLVLGGAFNQVNAYHRSLVFGGLNSGSSISDSFLPYDDEFEVDESNGTFSPQFSHVIPELAYEGGAIEFLSENVGTTRPLFYQAVVPGTTIDQAGDVLEEGRMNELNLGGAWEAAPRVMVGLSANFSFGTYSFTSLYEEADTRDENLPDDYIVVLSDGELRGFNSLFYEEGFESDLTGFNLRGGVSTSLSRGVRLGFLIETPTFYEVSEDYSREVETVFDEGGSLSASQDGQFEYSLRTPWRLGAGGAWENGNLLISGDLEYIDWSQMELDSDGAAFDDENRNIRESLDPVWNTRIGAEYSFGSLAVRGGFAYHPDPRSTEIQRGNETTDRSKTYFSAGLSYRFARQFSVDLGWMQERFDDEYLPYGDVEAPPVVEESVARNRFSAGVRVSL